MMKQQFDVMKKFISNFAMALAVCAITMVSCKKEINAPSEEKGVVFNASLESVKTSISEDGISWVKGDAVAILWGADGVATGVASTSGKSCVIVAEDAGEADTYYAFYPKSGYTSYADGSVTFSVPAESNGAFADANKSFAFTSAQDKSFEFKNVTGMIHFSVNSADIDKVVFAATAPVAGTLSVSFDKDGQLVLGDASETGNTITIAVGESREAYFSVLAGATLANGFTATCYDGETPVAVVSSATSVTIDRAELWDLGVLDSHIVTDYFVTPAGAGLKNGKNWENAFDAAALGALLMTPDVEDAEAVAMQALKLDGTTIHMAEGDYVIANPTKGLCQTDFAANGAKVSVTFLGGYPAGLTGKTTDGRDAATYKTAFSGNNQYGILSLGHKLDFSFDGIAFKNAHSNGNSRRAFSVSASSPEDASVAFKNCAFTDNIEANTGQSGAGAVITGAGVSFENCSFSGNKSRNGSAINMASGIVTAKDCQFTSNKSYNTSGAIQNAGATLTMDGCSFNGNTAAEGYPDNNGFGGAVHSNGATATTTLTGCTFEANTGLNGGAVSVQQATVVLRGCTFTGNKALSTSKDEASSNGLGGGAIYLTNSAADLTVEGCTFTSNKAENVNGGAIYANNCKSVKILGSTFSGNNAKFLGGAVVIMTGTLTIAKAENVRTVFDGNYSKSSGALHLAAGITSVISDCTFSKNYSTTNVASGTRFPTVSILGGTASFDGCVFDSNYGTSTNSCGIALYLENKAKVKFNKTNFIGNKTGNRGVIYTTGEAVLYFNDCLFKGNNVAAAWGNLIHQQNANDVVMMNGCTIYSNPGVLEFNNVAYSLIANSTIISAATNSVYRCYYSPTYFINNIWCAPSGLKIFYSDTKLDKITSGGHNVFNTLDGATGIKAGTDIIATVSGSFDEKSGKYVWDGPSSLSGFTPAAAADVKNAIKTNYNYNLNGINNIGNDFATWVESVGGFRTATTWWPGAYQAE